MQARARHENLPHAGVGGGDDPFLGAHAAVEVAVDIGHQQMPSIDDTPNNEMKPMAAEIEKLSPAT